MSAALSAEAPGALASEVTGPFVPLLRALRAAACGQDVSWVGDLATLRGNAPAKRALWPKLRALRRGH
jgi:hypothetical protein